MCRATRFWSKLFRQNPSTQHASSRTAALGQLRPYACNVASFWMHSVQMRPSTSVLHHSLPFGCMLHCLRMPSRLLDSCPDHDDRSMRCRGTTSQVTAARGMQMAITGSQVSFAVCACSVQSPWGRLRLSQLQPSISGCFSPSDPI